MVLSDHAFACTTFIVSGKNTDDGKPLLFKNRDTGEMNNALVLFEDGKYKYLALVNGKETSWNKSAWGGYNEKGFAIINSAAYNNNTNDTVTLKGRDGLLMKLALMYCSSLADFEHLLDTLPKPLGVNSNYGVIDASGGAAFYETGNFKYVKVDANDPAVAPRGIIIRTNHSMSGDLSKGFGYNRYDNATLLMNSAWQENNLTPQHLLQTIPRSLYHPRTKTDLSASIPGSREVPEYRLFLDYIPRITTSSSFMIVGAKDAEHADDAMMWTILGFPLTTVAIPVWLSSGELPKAAAMNFHDFKAPICTVALKFKEDCFPITIDHGDNYLNLSAVLNQEGTGYLQLLRPFEKEIFKKANLLIANLDNGKSGKKDIQKFYNWLDDYLQKSLKELFDVELFASYQTTSFISGPIH